MQILSTIKSIYVTVFSYIGRKLKEVVAWNKGLILGIKDDFSNKKYFIVVAKSFGMIVFLILQVLLFLTLFAAYISCKLTGVCLII